MKTTNKINGAVAIYCGIGGIIGAIAGIIAIVFWTYKVVDGQTNFSWGTLLFLISITIIFGLVGYWILKIGQEEYEK
jgi:predicted lysophospholipase L1 biosynthesis ABC-type transport system permease subunit